MEPPTDADIIARPLEQPSLFAGSMGHHEPIGDREREAGFAHRAIAVSDGTRCRCGRPLDTVLHRGRHEISWALYWSPRFIDGRRRDE